VLPRQGHGGEFAEFVVRPRSLLVGELWLQRF